MKLMQFVVGMGIVLVPVGANARTWFAENVQDASCMTLPSGGISSPADAEEMLRAEGFVPTADLENGPDGTLGTVTINYTNAGGDAVDMQFFTSMNGCQTQLKADISSGAVVDPSALK